MKNCFLKKQFSYSIGLLPVFTNFIVFTEIKVKLPKVKNNLIIVKNFLNSKI